MLLLLLLLLLPPNDFDAFEKERTKSEEEEREEAMIFCFVLFSLLFVLACVVCLFEERSLFYDEVFLLRCVLFSEEEF